MINLPQIIPRSWVAQSDSNIDKIIGRMNTIDSGIGDLEQIESTLTGNNKVTQHVKRLYDDVTKYANIGLNYYNRIKQIFGYDTKEYFKKSNGILGGIPVLVQSTSYSRNNAVSEFSNYDNQVFSDNMYINNYELKIEIICYGKEVLDSVNQLLELSRKRQYISFTYEKTKTTYSPIAITNISYSEDYKVQNVYIVSVTCKEIVMLKNGGIQLTNVFQGNTQSVKTVDLKKVKKGKPKKINIKKPIPTKSRCNCVMVVQNTKNNQKNILAFRPSNTGVDYLDKLRTQMKSYINK